MVKRIFILTGSLILVIILTLPTTYLRAEKVIVLKDGRKLEGEIIGSDDSSITIKSEDKVYTFERTDIKSLKKKMPREELLLPARELYEKMALRINQSDPAAHYKLGLFCLERNLADSAKKEFDRAKELDEGYAAIIERELKAVLESKAKGKYEAGLYHYYNGDYKKASEIFDKVAKEYSNTDVAKNLLQMFELSEQKLAQPGVNPDEKEIERRLKDGELPVPQTMKIAKVIHKFLTTLSSNKSGEDKPKIFRAGYIDMGKSFFEKAEGDKSPQRWESYHIAYHCYSLGFSGATVSPEEMRPGSGIIGIIQNISSMLDKNFEDKLIIAEDIKSLKEAEAFIGEFERSSRERMNADAWYYKTARDSESRAKDEQGLKRKNEFLRRALYSYLVLANSFSENPETVKAGVYGWARCFEELEKLK